MPILRRKKLIHFADFFCGEGERLDAMVESRPHYNYLGVDKNSRPGSLHPKVEFRQKDLTKRAALKEIGSAYRIRVLNLDMPDPRALTPGFFERIRSYINPDVLILTTEVKGVSWVLTEAGFHVSEEGYHELIPGEQEATTWTRALRNAKSVKTYLASPLRN
jgi:hypothetical protein